MPSSGRPPALTRRSLLWGAAGSATGAGLLAAAAGYATATGSGHRRAAAPTPNVLWIITDDQTRRMLKLMPRTMDGLVARGTNFVNGYVAVPWCGPSRATMLTGMYAHNHGVVSNDTLPLFLHKGLDHDTVATRMAAAGYTNGYFGKYLNGHGKEPSYVAPGWSRWVTTLDHVDAVNVDGEVRPQEVHRGAAPDHLAARQCRVFLRDHAAEPWFAVFAPTSPHDPYRPSRRHRHDFDDVVWDPPAFNEADMSDKPAFLQSLPPQDLLTMRRIYEGKLEELQDLDDQVDRLLQTLADTGQLDRTVIMLVSDNGYLLGEHRLFQKKQPYEESTGVPFVVSGPGVPAGESTALVSTADLMPTTLALAGLDPDAGRALDGRSMLDGLRSGSWAGWRRRLYSENPKLGWSMLRQDSFAFIDWYAEGGAVELYDLDDDPYQMRSVAGEVDVTGYRDVTDALRDAAGRSLRALEV
ncbi:sulfatase family protein [Nocardioides mangrovi]|uniref:Sulfatase n=1 Tax=Nocardioides mangrovi TaxID=2874580 RepID=A0ABS7U8L0_9ACTN|nr:sulfatase [Nocardioides mangrovi]MBZ5737313.1 sulfatase [Nocardioides mangrovi]